MGRTLQRLDEAGPSNAVVDELLELYHRAVPMMEKRLWQGEPSDRNLALYQALCREMENHYTQREKDDRHDLVIVIPVADRPLHLTECIDSILQQCELFNYGGWDTGGPGKVSVIVADDSAQSRNISSNKDIVNNYQRKGLAIEYFGLQEQQALLNEMSSDQRAQLRRILGNHDPSAFYHKGASITRNICYLKLHDIARQKKRPLFYFIDSDQEFKVNTNTGTGERSIFGLNYFYHLDRVFSDDHTWALTGKVVGDPPVSPSVMASHLLDDVIAFLQRIAMTDRHAACRFHNRISRPDDASYHDMAELFGFKRDDDAFEYVCPVNGAHDHVRCFEEFAAGLMCFFDGEHPTRKSGFEYEEVKTSIKPARTIYTGNYVIRPEALRFFIPFATLKLRMAGPVLGRLIKADISSRFVSAGLPMLHKRTVRKLGQSEYRAGIDRNANRVDLGAEFERQYYGDVMLFTIEKLTEQGYPNEFTARQVRQLVQKTDRYINQKYRDRHRAIVRKLDQLRILFRDDDWWWNRESGLQSSLQEIDCFINNMEHNFGDNSRGWHLINSIHDRQQQLQHLVDALLAYVDDNCAWHHLINDLH